MSQSHTNVEKNPRKPVDAADVEHIAALVAGGLLTLVGFRKKGFAGALCKAGGVALLMRGQKGYRKLYNAMGIQLLEQPSGVGRQNVRVESMITVERPREELYRIWRNLENLPVFMDHLVEVIEVDDIRSHWIAKAPAGTVIQWDAWIINDIENELIAWETLEGSGVDNAGSIHFEEVSKGVTRIRVVLRYDPPADLLGAVVAKVFGNDPQREIDQDLKRFKRIMEVGAVLAHEEKRSRKASLA